MIKAYSSGEIAPHFHDGVTPPALDPKRVLATVMERDELLSAVEAAVDWFGQAGEDATERFERIADEFYRATGFLRPGKSEPAECGDRTAHREAAWAVWRDEKNRKVRADLATALARARR